MKEHVKTKEKERKKSLFDNRYQLATLIGNQAIQKLGSDDEEEPQTEERASSSSEPSLPDHTTEPRVAKMPITVGEPERAALTDAQIEARLRAEAAKDARRTRTPAVSVVYNRRTGKIYRAQNGINVPTKFSRPIEPRVQAIHRLAPAAQYKDTIGHGHHAEVIAANAAFESDDECTFEDLVVCTVRGQVKHGLKAKSGEDFPTCPDCEYILSGAKLVTGDTTKANAPSYLRATKKRPRRLSLPPRYIPVPAPKLLTSPMPVIIKSSEDKSSEVELSTSTEEIRQELDDEETVPSTPKLDA